MSQNRRIRIGEQFRQRREKEGWSVEQVAMMSEVRVVTIEKIEAGVFNVPLDILAKVADVLGCELAIKQIEV